MLGAVSGVDDGADTGVGKTGGVGFEGVQLVTTLTMESSAQNMTRIITFFILFSFGMGCCHYMSFLL